MASIDAYCIATRTCPKNLAVVGPPGCGKTHTMSHLALYGRSRGLICVTTAFLCQRAFLLGGIHLHRLFCILVCDACTAHCLAELAIIALNKCPLATALLLAMDVSLPDELQQKSAKFFSALDIIMRQLRGSSLFYGGCLIIGTLDHLQLCPISGKPFLLSPHVLTTFVMRRLKHSVRAARCPYQRRLNKIARHTGNFSDHRREFVQLLRQCTFVSSWDSPQITDDVYRIFARTKDALEATEKFVARKKRVMQARLLPFVNRIAEDTMVPLQSHGNWSVASKPVTAFLNNNAREPENLAFFPRAIYEFTYNSPGKFSNTQIGILLDVPSRVTLDAFGKIELFVTPVGASGVPDATSSPAMLERSGWKRQKVGKAPVVPHNNWSQGLRVKRRQYGIRHHVANTIHAAIGSTIFKLATCLSNGPPSRELWERSMAVVLLSRTKRARDIIFVGDRRRTVKALVYCLSLRDQYTKFMSHVVDVLCGETPSPLIELPNHPFRPRDIALPADTSGFVYILLSLKDTRTTYIGKTVNLHERLRSHNSGYGSRCTAPEHLRPWGLLGYVAGFENDTSSMFAFERRWQERCGALFRGRNAHSYTPLAAAGLAQEIIPDFRHLTLRLVMAATTL